MHLAQLQRPIPGVTCARHHARVGAVLGVQHHGVGRQPLVTRGLGIRGAAVVAHDPEHVVTVRCIARERAQLRRHFGGCRVRHPGQDGRQRTADRATLDRVIGMTKRHQQTADIGVAQTQRAVAIAEFRDLLGRKLCHQYGHFQRDRPEPRGMFVGLDVKNTAIEELQQVHRRQVAGRVVQEHVLRARIRRADLA